MHSLHRMVMNSDFCMISNSPDQWLLAGTTHVVTALMAIVVNLCIDQVSMKLTCRLPAGTTRVVTALMAIVVNLCIDQVSTKLTCRLPAGTTRVVTALMAINVTTRTIQ